MIMKSSWQPLVSFKLLRTYCSTIQGLGHLTCRYTYICPFCEGSGRQQQGLPWEYSILIAQRFLRKGRLTSLSLYALAFDGRQVSRRVRGLRGKKFYQSEKVRWLRWSNCWSGCQSNFPSLLRFYTDLTYLPIYTHCPLWWLNVVVGEYFLKNSKSTIHYTTAVSAAILWTVQKIIFDVWVHWVKI